MATSNFTEKFLEIANNRDAFCFNNPAKLVFAAIDYRALAQRMTIEQANESLLKEPNFGGQGEIGGVNVYHFTDGQYDRVQYTDDSDSTWMTLSSAVKQAFQPSPNSQPDWYSEHWVQVINEREDLAII